MKTLAVALCCTLLAGCATYVPPQGDAAVLVRRDGMRSYRPLPREERQVSMCDMSEKTKAVTCR